MDEGRLGDEIGYQLKRAQHALRVRMDGALREVGLTTPQYAALRVLAEAPDLSGAELARRSFVTPQTMNQILVNLEAAGLVERRPHPVHGRVLQARLTGAGREKVSRADRMAEDVTRRMLSGLNRDDQLRLLGALRGCTDALERDVVVGDLRDGRAGDEGDQRRPR